MGDGEGGAGGSAVRSLREASRGGSGNGLGKGRWGGKGCNFAVLRGFSHLVNRSWVRSVRVQTAKRY